MPDENEKIGMTKEEAKREMDRLRDQAARIVSNMSTAPELHKKAQHQQELRQIGERVAQAREWYSVGVLESLEAETGTLHSATEKLLESSNVLEYLTRILIAVTIVVVGEPLIEQLFGIWGLPVFLAVAILGTYYLTRIFRPARD